MTTDKLTDAMIEALEPFAAVAKDSGLKDHPDSYAPRPSRGRPNMGDYRRALAAIEARPQSPAPSPDADLVERVAQAICAAEAKRKYGIDRGEYDAWVAATDYARSEWLADSRAAIEALTATAPPSAVRVNADGTVFTSEDAANETTRLQRELDITNADHIALWLEANTIPDEPMNQCASWLACRIVEAHEAAITPPSDSDAKGGVA